MKVCSLYGAGFYYIPGTDICMKIGGYVRYQLNMGSNQSTSFGPFFTASGFNTRSTGIDLAQRVRVILSQDTRQQTAYGTLRTYFILGWTHDSPTVAVGPGPGVYFNRGFIQIAGFTFGKATSFFDFVSTAAVAYNAGFLTTSDTGDAGQIVGAYTAQFGNGMSATIGIEQSRRDATFFAGGLPLAGAGTVLAIGGAPAFDNLGGAGAAGTASRPDIVGNWRIDQAWGSAQISGALHDVSASYYGGPTGTAVLGTTSGHPDDKWGWAASIGFRFNTPMIGPGDYFQTAFIYSEGAMKYASFSGCGQTACDYMNGSSFGFGFGTDGSFAGTPGGVAQGDIQLSTAWSAFASYEHFWTPALRTSLYGSYLAVSRNAQGNANLCNGVLNGAGFAAFTAGTFGCDMDYQVWSIGSRSQWNVTKDLYVGVDVIYSKLQSATLNGGAPFLSAAFLNAGVLPAGYPKGLYNTADQDTVAVTWRVHRDIVP